MKANDRTPPALAFLFSKINMLKIVEFCVKLEI